MAILKWVLVIAGIISAAIGDVEISIACLIIWGVAYTFGQHEKAHMRRTEY